MRWSREAPVAAGLALYLVRPRRANDHCASILLSIGCHGDGSGLVRGALGVAWFLYRAIRECTDCVPDTAGFGSCDSPGRERREACDGISAFVVHSGSLDCDVGCDRARRRIRLAVSGSVVRGKWRVDRWPVAWRCGYLAVSALEQVSCGLQRRL